MKQGNVMQIILVLLAIWLFTKKQGEAEAAPMIEAHTIGGGGMITLPDGRTVPL